jgi:RNA recognition motif-containing protein
VARTSYEDRISVRGLPLGTSEDDVKAFFASAGAIKKVRVGKPVTSITFETVEGATAALSFSGQTYAGAERPLKVNKSVKKAPKSAKTAKAAAKAGVPATKAEAGAAKATNAERRAGKGLRVVMTGANGATEDSIKSFFASAGAVDRVTVRKDGTVDVSFTSSDGADAAIALNGKKLGAAVVTVVPYASRRRRGPAREEGAAGAPAESGAGRKRTTEAPSAEEVANLIWVSGLAEGSDEASVRKTFGSFGKIAEVWVKGSKARTFAYVKFEAAGSAERAIASPVEGLKVEKASRLPKA